MDELVNSPVGFGVEWDDNVEFLVKLVDLILVELALDLVSSKRSLLSAPAIIQFAVTFDAEQIAHL